MFLMISNQFQLESISYSSIKTSIVVIKADIVFIIVIIVIIIVIITTNTFIQLINANLSLLITLMKCRRAP